MYGELHAAGEDRPAGCRGAGRGESPRLVSRRASDVGGAAGDATDAAQSPAACVQHADRARSAAAIAAAASRVSPGDRRQLRDGAGRALARLAVPATLAETLAPLCRRIATLTTEIAALDARLQTRTASDAIVARLQSRARGRPDRGDDVPRVRRSARAVSRTPGQVSAAIGPGAARRQLRRASAPRPHHQGRTARAAQSADPGRVGVLAPCGSGTLRAGSTGSRRAAGDALRWSPWRVASVASCLRSGAMSTTFEVTKLAMA